MKKNFEEKSPQQSEEPAYNYIGSIVGAIAGKRLELKAAAPIWPGMFVRRIDKKYVEPHDSEADTVPRLIAIENFCFGADITRQYAIDDDVVIYHCFPGDVVYSLVSPSSAHIDAGDFLICADDGGVKLAVGSYQRPPDTTDRAIIGMAIGFEIMMVDSDQVYIATEIW